MSKKIKIGVTATMLLFLVGCAGLQLADEERDLLRSLGDELDEIQGSIREMREAGDYDLDRMLDLLARSNEVKVGINGILRQARDKDFEWYDYLGFLLGGLLSYFGGRGIRKGGAALMNRARA